MITPGQRLPCALVPSAADLKVRTPKTEIPRQSYQAVALETRDSDRVLHPRRERPRDSRATKRRDELASPHGRTPRPRITNYSRSRCASQQKRPAHVRFGSWSCQNAWTGAMDASASTIAGFSGLETALIEHRARAMLQQQRRDVWRLRPHRCQERSDAMMLMTRVML